MKLAHDSQLWKSLSQVKLSSMSISANCALAFLTVTVVNFYEVQTFQKAHFWHTANGSKTIGPSMIPIAGTLLVFH